MNFEFATAQRIIFGCGKINTLPELAPGLGSKAALITGSSAQRIAPIFNTLKKAGTEPAAFSISGEPTVNRIAQLADGARELGCDYVVAFGGGSVIDAGKAIAALLTNTDDIMNYLEVIGKGLPLTEDPAPCIAIPTTAGTGSEVTRNAVLLSEEHQVKVSMRHPGMLPTIALVDPELTLTMPPEVTASTGLDAFIQLLEAFVSKKANPITDALCREGLRRMGDSLYRVYIKGTDLEARTNMAFASLCGGLALANAGLGVIHGFAGPIGGMFKAPHGLICASLLHASARINHEALQSRADETGALEKYREAAQLILRNPNATIDDALDGLKNICAQMFIPGLEEFGITHADIPVLVEKAKKSSSMKGNPIKLTDEELIAILQESMDAPIDGDATLYM
ncbi:iron-containing alcohol dehydrogenase [Pontiella agarivorans]|uniref:Iron-containing alcohol dehydrogenase n=1 Tax=Pontiella agarivorans TaxID=3038953 RepID=A0ABU5MXW3_9BACT|nr:iron-containing alcohol dehydrogenase [Pontiella agarivorans]MDZ8118993.1 iron-containing alcohol dehydrogenase [Pontiella agarivorans]